MDLNPFKAVSNYSEMLDKISLFNFFGGIILFYIMVLKIPEVGQLSTIYNFDLEVAGNKFSLMNIAIPFLIAMISRILKLHDKISDIFGIRKRYDRNNIIIPIAQSVNIETLGKIEILDLKREEILENIFYPYTSTDPNKCKINHHHVLMAMDQLTWYWIIIEYTFLISIAIITSVVFWNLRFLLTLSIVWVLLFIFSFIILKIVKRYTSLEVKQITEKKEFSKNIKHYLNELFS